MRRKSSVCTIVILPELLFALSVALLGVSFGFCGADSVLDGSQQEVQTIDWYQSVIPNNLCSANYSRFAFILDV